MASRTIRQMTNLEARRFLKKETSYVSFELPPYIHFQQLIVFVSTYLKGKKLTEVFKAGSVPANFENVNYTILSNKNGAYSWRPMQIINPVLYIDLVNLITEEANWRVILQKFESSSKSYVDCISIPRESLDNESDRAWQITNWWEAIEQETIRLSLNYAYMAVTDITDCYGSIYTHSIEWALDDGGREGAKERLRKHEKSDGIGATVDKKLRNMNSGQTVGIPQGSVLMDLIAELVLSYADIELTKRIEKKGYERSDFKILRYRDDYRILSTSPVIAHQILKELDMVLYELGLKMNPSKTTSSSDIIGTGIKGEKLESILLAPAYLYFQKEALRIMQLSKKYPNAGIVSKDLAKFYDKFTEKKEHQHVDYEVIISIMVQVALDSPRTIHLVAGICSKLLEKIENEEKRQLIVKNIVKKFQSMPNTGLIDIWLQRISRPMGIDYDYEDTFTKVATHDLDNSVLWNCEWLNDDIISHINFADISTLPDQLEDQTITYVVEREEFELYRLPDY